MDLTEYRGRLLAVPLIQSLPLELQHRIAMVLLWIGQHSHVSVGDDLFVEGDDDENTGCVLLSGEVDVLRSGAEPVRCPAPDLFGEMKQLEETAQRTATVQVVADGEVLQFNWHDFVGFAGTVLTTDEQLALKQAILDAAQARRQSRRYGL
jgi:CRP-like cAMP-binding protein